MNDRREYVGSVSLLITGRDLDPDLVSKTLGIRPSQSWRRGDTIGSSSSPAKAKNGGWKKFVAVAKRNAYLESQLSWWASTLRSKVKAIRKVNALGYNCRLSIFAASDATVSVVVPVSLQRALASLGLPWELSVSLAHEDAT
jgi:hypothetical protein